MKSFPAPSFYLGGNQGLERQKDLPLPLSLLVWRGCPEPQYLNCQSSALPWLPLSFVKLHNLRPWLLNIKSGMLKGVVSISQLVAHNTITYCSFLGHQCLHIAKANDQSSIFISTDFSAAIEQLITPSFLRRFPHLDSSTPHSPGLTCNFSASFADSSSASWAPKVGVLKPWSLDFLSSLSILTPEVISSIPITIYMLITQKCTS